MLSMQKILVTTDLSSVSKEAFPLATGMAKAFGASITCLHIFEEDLLAVYPMIAGYMQPEMIAAGEYREEAKKRAAQALESLAESFRNEGIKTSTMLRTGAKPFAEIVKAARELPADLIVCATHGRTGLRHALIGSTAERVVRKAPCAVLTVKPQGFEYAAP